MPGSERDAGCDTGGGGSAADGGAAADFGSAGAGAPAVGGTSRRAAGGGGAVASSRLGARLWPDIMIIAGRTRPSGRRRAKTLANQGSPLVKYQMRA